MNSYMCLSLSLTGLLFLTLVVLNHSKETNDGHGSLQESYLNDASSGFKVNVSKTFHLHLDELTWVEALIKCYSMNLRLASIENQKEQDLVVSVIRKTRSKSYQSGYWVAGSDLSGHRMFKWMTNNKDINRLTYKNWGTKEPDHLEVNISRYRDVEHCISLSDHLDFKWSDSACSQRMHFLCEQDDKQKTVFNENQKSLQKNKMSSDVRVKVPSRKRFQLGSKKEEITWIEALIKCYSMNMRLASIESQEEQDRVVAMIRETDSEWYRDDFWISGSDLNGNRTFKWMTTGRLLTYKNWRAGEPDRLVEDIPHYKDAEHCISMIEQFDYNWSDSACSERMYFICEQDV